jgi:hypothetical protein
MIIQERNGVIRELGSILRLSAKFNECDRSWMRKVQTPVATTLRISSSQPRNSTHFADFLVLSAANLAACRFVEREVITKVSIF